MLFASLRHSKRYNISENWFDSLKFDLENIKFTISSPSFQTIKIFYCLCLKSFEKHDSPTLLKKKLDQKEKILLKIFFFSFLIFCSKMNIIIVALRIIAYCMLQRILIALHLSSALSMYFAEKKEFYSAKKKIIFYFATALHLIMLVST